MIRYNFAVAARLTGHFNSESRRPFPKKVRQNTISVAPGLCACDFSIHHFDQSSDDGPSIWSPTLTLLTVSIAGTDH
jgi:hypothetical protein